MKIKKVNELAGQQHFLMGIELENDQTWDLLNFFKEINEEVKNFTSQLGNNKLVCYYKDNTLTFVIEGTPTSLVVKMNFSIRTSDVSKPQAPKFTSKATPYIETTPEDRPLNPPKFKSKTTSQYDTQRPKELGEE